MTPTAAEIAWAAGLFEGEGCIIVTRNTPTGHPRVALSLNSTDRDVLERLARIVGYGDIKVSRTKRAVHHKQQFVWACGTNAVTARILELLRPWLCDRRGARADEALVTLAWSRTHCHRGHDKPLDQRGCAVCLAVGERPCPQGHPRVPENVGRNARGAIKCLACERERAQRRRAAARALVAS